MRIKRVHITNFRCLQDIGIEFDQITTFIGPNGVGKSTVLRALDWFFNGGKGPLRDIDCSHGNTDEEIRVEVEFSELTDEDRVVLGHYAREGVDIFIAWKHRAPEGVEKMSANTRGYQPFSVIRSIENKPERKTAYNALRASDETLGLPSAGGADAIETAFRAWESEHPESLSEVSGDLSTSFFGFNSQAKMAGLFDYVLVTADLRASEEAIDTKSSVIGRFLERTVDRTAADVAIATLTAEVETRQRDIYSEHFQEQLDDISEALTDAVTQYSEGRSILVKNEEVALTPPVTKFFVNVVDEELTTTIDRQGHGFQRTLLISALQLLAKRGAAAESNGTICLAIEEPELFQHPVQAQSFAEVLRNLAEDSSQRIQVTYATHSPYFVEAQRFHQIRRLTRSRPDPNKPSKIDVHFTSLAKVTAALTSYVRPETIQNQVDSTILNSLSEALFANGVAIVEGGTDRAVIEGVACRDSGKPLSVNGIVVAKQGGKPSLLLPCQILKGLGIPVFMVFDSDITNADPAEASMNKKILGYLGATVESWPAGQVYSSYAVFENTLESVLMTEWPEWQIAVDEIISKGIGDPKKNSVLYKQATVGAEGTAPAHLNDIITKLRNLA